MAADAQGNDINRVLVPTSSRTIIGEVSETITLKNLKNTLWYPKGGTWEELGLLKQDGGPEWLMDNIADAQNWVNKKAAILNGDVQVGLRITVAEYSTLLFKLHDGKEFGSKGYGSIIKPQDQKKWLVFHEDRFKNPKGKTRVRRRAFVARATVSEEKMERGFILGHEIIFNILPVVLAGSGDDTSIGNIGTPKYDDNGNIDLPAIPPVDLNPGSGLPGFDNLEDGGPTIPIPGSDSSDAIPLLDADNELDSSVGPDENSYWADKPSVVDDIKPPIALNCKWHLDSQHLKIFASNEVVPIANQQIIFRAITIEGKHFHDGSIAFDSASIDYDPTSAGTIKWVLGLYESSSDSHGNRPGALIYSFPAQTKSWDTRVILDAAEDFYVKSDGLYWLGLKRIDVGNTEDIVLSGIFDTFSPVARNSGEGLTKPLNWNERWYIDTGNDSEVLPSSAEGALQTRSNLSVDLQPLILLSMKELS